MTTLNNRKKYYLQYNIGHCKYILNLFDGQKTHVDGSEFWDVEIFKNKKKFRTRINEIESIGYIPCF